jgi:hypothetical protein
MRTSIRIFGLLSFVLFIVPSIFAQTNPPPSDPHELVIHQPRTLSSPGERSAAIDLLQRAQQDLNMHTFGSYQLKASFQTSGARAFERAGVAVGCADARCDRGSLWRKWARVRRESQ